MYNVRIEKLLDLNRKILSFMSIFLMSFMAASAENYTINYNNYCASTSTYRCLWCASGGTPAGNCVADYAGCTGGAEIVQVNYNSNGIRCTQSGFCYNSCSGRWVIHPTIPNMEVWQTCSGCTCSDCKNTTTTQCKSGYELSADGKCLVKCAYGKYRDDKGTCVACPKVLRKTSSGDLVDFYGMRVSGESIKKNCFLPYNIEYEDETGGFSVIGEYCYWEK